MTPIFVILIIAAVLVSETLPGIPLMGEEPSFVVAAWALAPLAAIAGLFHTIASWCGVRIDRTGRVAYVRWAERALLVSRLTILMAHLWAVIGLGWPLVVRSWLGGDWVLVDEALVVLGPLAALVATWWSYAGIDRRLHEASLMGLLDQGLAPPPLPSRWGYTLEHIRHDLLILLVPVGAILAWTEIADWIVGVLMEGPDALNSARVGGALAAAHFAGVLVVLLFMPLALRLIWRTVPLGPSPLRERLEALCRAQRVRCRNILVWRTHSGLLNGAVIGLVGRLRFILLTETLLERLGERHIEAVMAHEVAHARWRHMPWLMLGLLATVGGAWTLVAWGLDATIELEELSPRALGIVLVGALGAATIVGLVAFGVISRRFEEQADAFATQHLSGMRRDRENPDDLVITPEAAGAMASALGEVAALNCLDLDRFMWRHGSIRSRQRRLLRLVGKPARVLPIDRRVRRLKIVTLILVAGLIVVAAVRPDLVTG